VSVLYDRLDVSEPHLPPTMCASRPGNRRVGRLWRDQDKKPALDVVGQAGDALAQLVASRTHEPAAFDIEILHFVGLIGGGSRPRPAFTGALVAIRNLRGEFLEHHPHQSFVFVPPNVDVLKLKIDAGGGNMRLTACFWAIGLPSMGRDRVPLACDQGEPGFKAVPPATRAAGARRSDVSACRLFGPNIGCCRLGAILNVPISDLPEIGGLGHLCARVVTSG
jgi:hypothetical protein